MAKRYFFNEKDRIAYLKYIKYYSIKYKLIIWAYSLMNNHIHFVVIPEKEDSMARTFSIAHMIYAQDINQKRKNKGHLWQGRFYSRPMDERHTYVAIKYIEQNPVRAGLAEKSRERKRTSAAYHIGGEDIFGILQKSPILPCF